MHLENNPFLFDNPHKLDLQKQAYQAIDGVSTQEQITAKAREFEEIFIADILKNAQIGMTDSSLVQDTKITDTFSTFMNKALAETIVSQGGFGLTEKISQSLMHAYSKNNVSINHKEKEL
jgi:Rod binding domain-containing protein